MRRLTLKSILVHENQFQAHGWVRLSLPVMSMAINGANFTCKRNAQKTNHKTLDSVLGFTGQINKIEWYRKLGNLMRIMNMPIVYAEDTRNKICEFKRRAVFWDTYRAFERVWRLALGWFYFSDCQGNDWDRSWLLNLPLSVILVSHFFVSFASFSLLLSTDSSPPFRAFAFYMYHGMC